MSLRDYVAEFLIKENFLLTALEFFHELAESGYGEQKLLKEFFENKQFQYMNNVQQEKSNKKQDSKAQLLQTEIYEEALKKKDEEISLLKYEFNVLKQESEKMKAQLRDSYVSKTQRQKYDAVKSATTPTTTNMDNNPSNDTNDTASNTTATPIEDDEVSHLQDEPIKDQEKQVINFLLKKYLSENTYKMTAISFSEEMGDSEILNDEIVSKEDIPLSILYLYRYYYQLPKTSQNRMKDTKALHQALQQLEEKKEALQALRATMEEQEQEISKLTVQNKNLESELEQVKKNPSIAVTDSKTSVTTTTQDTAKQPTTTATLDVKAKTPVVSPTDKQEDKPISVSQQGLHREVTLLQAKVKDLEDKDRSLVFVLGEKLPSMIDGSKKKHRDEFLPLILTTIQHHPDLKVRQALADLMFNIVKKPTDKEREYILSAFSSLARRINPDRFETEVISQFWGHMQDKNHERRLLLAEACGQLSPNVKPHLRAGLFLSVLNSYSDDSNEFVRNASVTALSKIMAGFEDDDKYHTLEQLFLKFLFDPSELVIKTTLDLLGPAFAQFASDFNLIFDRFATTILGQMETEIFKKSTKYSERMSLLLQAFRLCIPKYYENILKTTPESLLKIDKDRTANYKKFLESQLSQDIEKAKEFWNTLDWICTTGVKRLLTIVASVDVSETLITNELTQVFETLCQVFGPTYVNIVLKPAFVGILNHDQEVTLISKTDVNIEQRKLFTKARILPIYLCGVLSTMPKEQFGGFVKDVITHVAVKEKTWSQQHVKLLKAAINQACKVKKLQDEVLSVTWNLIFDPSVSVRSTVVEIFRFIIDALDSETISKQVLPAMISLSSDPEKIVRIQALHGVGDVCINVASQKDLDKIQVQIENFFNESQREFHYEALKVLAAIIPKLDKYLRDNFVVKRLDKIGHVNNTNPDTADRKMITYLLHECYRGLTGCLLSKDILKHHILPGLEMLERDADFIGENSIKNSARGMLKDVKEKLASTSEDAKSSTNTASQQAQGKQPQQGGLGNLVKNMFGTE